METSDGTSRHEEGFVKDVGSDHAAISVQGSFSYKDEKDGKQYSVSYIADENGFQPTGEHLPQLPAIQHWSDLSSEAYQLEVITVSLFIAIIAVK